MEEKTVKFYGKNFEFAKDVLDSISPTFCAAKWLQVSLHLTNGHTHSCYHPPVHKINPDELEDNPSALHNTKQKFQERKMMLSGERPEGCQYCWKIEDSGHISDRYYRSSEHWAVNQLEVLSSQAFDFNVIPTYVEVNFNQTCNFKCSYCSPHLSSEWEKEIKEFGPYEIGDYKHNDIKNLKNLGLMPIEGSTRDNVYIQAFWKWWPEIYSSLQMFRMTGGEPLMDSNTFRVLDYILENPNKNLELSITSNLCPVRQDLFDKFLDKVKKLDSVTYKVECYVPDPKDGSDWQSWPHYIIGEESKKYHNSNLPSIEREDITQTFLEIGPALEDGSFTYLYEYQDTAIKNFSLYVSLDSVGKQAEYIRNGLEYDRLISNVRKFLDETSNTSVNFINTFNILSITGLKKFLELIKSLRAEYSADEQRLLGKEPIQRIWFDIPLLRRPEWMSIQNARSEDIELLEGTIDWMKQFCNDQLYKKTLTGFKKYEVEKLERNLNIIKNSTLNQDTLDKNKADFKLFFSEHDRRRGTDFCATFPEFKEWYRN